MKKEKVAFVVVRYGKNINGGAEYHCQMLAERLVSDYDVEVLTTCVRDVATGENIYPEGEEEWNGVVIRRFRTNPVQREKERYFAKKAKPARKLRQFLFNLGILSYKTNTPKSMRFNVLGLMNYMNTELLIGMSCDLENAFDALPKFTAMLQSIEVNE